MTCVPNAQRSRASALSAWLDGWRRTFRLWPFAIGILALTGGLALGLRSAIQADLGGSVVIASGFLDARPLPPAVAAVVVIHLACWLFLWGGLLDRLAGPRRGGPVGFFAASGLFAFRFLRLAVMSGAAYWLVLMQLHPWIFNVVHPGLMRDVTSEWQAAATRTAGYLVVLAAVAVVAVTMDLARVRTVVEDRRSMLGAVTAAIRFIRRRPAGVVALVTLNVAALLLVLGVWSLAAPGATAGTIVAIGATQAYLLARILTRVSLAASLLALVQAEFPRATDAAPLPEPIWPDAPAATSDDLL